MAVDLKRRMTCVPANQTGALNIMRERMMKWMK